MYHISKFQNRPYRVSKFTPYRALEIDRIPRETNIKGHIKLSRLYIVYEYTDFGFALFSVNGNKQDKSVQFLNREDVCEWVGHLKDRSGEDLKRIMKQQHTDSPSIQGIWTPFTNAPSHLNVASFPSEIDSGCVQNDGTDATQELLGVAKRLRLGATTGRSVSESGSSEASTTS